VTWHTLEQPYWNESAFYEFTAKEVDCWRRPPTSLRR